MQEQPESKPKRFAEDILLVSREDIPDDLMEVLPGWIEDLGNSVMAYVHGDYWVFWRDGNNVAPALWARLQACAQELTEEYC